MDNFTLHVIYGCIIFIILCVTISQWKLSNRLSDELEIEQNRSKERLAIIEHHDDAVSKLSYVCYQTGIEVHKDFAYFAQSFRNYVLADQAAKTRCAALVGQNKQLREANNKAIRALGKSGADGILFNGWIEDKDNKESYERVCHVTINTQSYMWE